jgi:uncharacterized protein YecE (DUF72 family)
VEINATFYRLPAAAAVETWRDGVPDRFLFSCKGSRFITHMKKLRDPEGSFERYFERIRLLGSRLGPILFQLPPRWQVNVERLAAFLAAIPADHRYTFELRDASWHRAEVLDLLRRHRAALCLYDFDGRQCPIEVTTDFVYVRLHGPGARYRGSYDDETLQGWARRLLEWQGAGLSSYIYFDNDEKGYAAGDALRLKAMLGPG